MKKLTVFLVLCLAFSNFTNAQEALRPEAERVNGFRAGYQKLMQRAFMDLAQNYGISDTILVRLIPESIEEYAYFIDMSKHEKDSLKTLTEGYNKYIALLDKKATAKDDRLYQKIIYLGEFARGEFGEFYYNITDRLVNQDQALFCTVYKREPGAKLAKLKRYSLACK